MKKQSHNLLTELIEQVETKIEAEQATPEYLDEVQQKLNDMPTAGTDTKDPNYQYALELQALIYDASGKEEEMVRSVDAAVEQAGSPGKLQSRLLKAYLRKHPSTDSESDPEVQQGPGDMSLLSAREQRFMRSYELESMPEVSFLVRKPVTLFVMLLLSGGLYGTYWFYKNWQAVRDDTGNILSPFWRTVFSIFYVWPLFKIMTLLAKSRGYKVGYSGGLLAAGYVFLPLIAIPVYLFSSSLLLVISVELLLDCVTFGLLVLAQQAAIFAVTQQPSTKPKFRPINYVEWIFVVVGFFFFLNATHADVKQTSRPYQSGLQQLRSDSTK